MNIHIPFTGNALRIGKSDAALKREIRELEKKVEKLTTRLIKYAAENERLVKKNLEITGRQSEALEIKLHSEAMKRFTDRG